MATPKGQNAGLNYAKLRNQKKNKSSLDIDKDLSYRGERNSISPQQDKQYSQTPHGFQMFDNIEMDAGNLGYINELLAGKREKSANHRDKSQGQNRHNRIKSAYNDKQQDEIALAQQQQLLMQQQQQQQQQLLINQNQMQQQQQQSILRPQLMQQIQPQQQYSSHQQQMQQNQYQNKTPGEKLFGQFFSQKNEFDSKDDFSNMHSISKEEMTFKQPQMMNQQNIIDQNNSSIQSGRIQKQDGDEGFMKAIDDVLDYFTRSSQESTQPNAKNFYERSARKRENSQAIEQVQILLGEKKILKQQVENLEKKLKEFQLTQRQFIAQLQGSKQKESDTKKVIKKQEKEIIMLVNQNKELKERLDMTQAQFVREKIEHENTQIALKQLISRQVINQGVDPNLIQQQQRNFQKGLKESKSHDRNLLFNYDVKKGYYQNETSIQQSTSTLNEDIREESDNPSIRSSLDEEADMDDFQQYYQEIRRENNNQDQQKRKNKVQQVQQQQQQHQQQQSQLTEQQLQQVIFMLNQQQKKQQDFGFQKNYIAKSHRRNRDIALEEEYGVPNNSSAHNSD